MTDRSIKETLTPGDEVWSINYEVSEAAELWTLVEPTTLYFDQINPNSQPDLSVRKDNKSVEFFMTHWVQDIYDLHEKMGMHPIVNSMDEETKRKFLAFRADFLQEELDELRDNIDNPEEVVDALIDLCVVAIGTLDLFGVDAKAAWDAVKYANMAKEPGTNETRPNEFGAPDLIKPEGWTPPNHGRNHGNLPRGPK